jgi:glyoxylase-like metal-dependent hydrolase (beta-lactamase superfamily II)
MTEDLSAGLAGALRRAGIDAVPIVMPTPWEVGAVTAYLFPGEPVTLVDSGVDTVEGKAALTKALAEHGRRPSDVKCVLVTHAHTDHFGGAIWLQAESGCEVYVHEADLAMSTDPDWQETERQIFPTLGFTPEEVERFFSDEGYEWRFPDFTPFPQDASFDVGDATLSVEHHPGHTPGHVWITEERSGAIFVGDYVLANHPTNAGLERDADHPSGRAQLLQLYNAGLRELLERDTPVLLPAHGPPIAGHRELLTRRLQKTDRRTRNVLEALREAGIVTGLELGRRMYRDRIENWEVVADLVGRLDLLIAEGRVTARMGEDGAWRFQATHNEEET